MNKNEIKIKILLEKIKYLRQLLQLDICNNIQLINNNCGGGSSSQNIVDKIDKLFNELDELVQEII